MSTCTACNKQVFRELETDLCEECEDVVNCVIGECEDESPLTLEEYLNELLCADTYR